MGVPISDLSWKSGLIRKDRLTHVVTYAPGGTAVAMCGLGMIIQHLPRDYRIGEKLNCSQCDTDLTRRHAAVQPK